MVYKYLYQSSCFQSLKSSCNTDLLIEYQSNCTKDDLIDMFSGMQSSQRIPAFLHKERIHELKLPWNIFRSNRTCLCCLRRKRENTLTCGHSICDVCVQIFGHKLFNAEYQFQVDQCLLCQSGTLEVILKPPTAGVRILSIDGGGIRGVVPLEFLGMLQDLVGLDCPIQNLFDLAFGTSSGTLS